MRGFFRSAVVLILTWEARAVLKRLKPRIIAITGSVGKTTTKDAIYTCLKDSRFIRKSEKSFNSEIGVPLTILGCENAWSNPLKWLTNIVRGLILIVSGEKYPEWLVVEVGADRPGDIRRIARWLRPDIAVLTGIPELPVHIEFFDSPEALMREKRALAEYLKPGGTLVMYGDDRPMVNLCADFRNISFTYGFGGGNTYRASREKIMYEKKNPIGMRFRLVRSAMPGVESQAKEPISLEILGTLGRPRVYAALAAFAVGELTGVDETSIIESLRDWEPSPGRMRILPGRNGSTIIDDTYNSSPAATLAALDALKEVKATRRVAALGDMLELGRYSAEAHRNVGARAAEIADMLITVGFRARATGEAALDAGMPDSNVREYEQHEAGRAGRERAEELEAGDVVLVKGSQSMRMERAVKELMAEPERAAELLVRQDEEWKYR